MKSKGAEAVDLVLRCRQNIEAMGGSLEDPEMAALGKILNKLERGEILSGKEIRWVDDLACALQQVDEELIVRVDNLLNRDFSDAISKVLTDFRAGLAAGRPATSYQLRVVERLETGLLPNPRRSNFILTAQVKQRLSWITRLAGRGELYRRYLAAQKKFDYQYATMTLLRYNRRGVITRRDYEMLLSLFEDELQELEKPRYPVGRVVQVNTTGFYRQSGLNRDTSCHLQAGTICLILTSPDVVKGDIAQVVLVDQLQVLVRVNEILAVEQLT